MRTLIVADYLLGGSTIKRSVLNIQSVKSVERSEGHAELKNLESLASEEGSQPLSRALENDFIAPTAVPLVTQQPTEEKDNRIEGASAENVVPISAAGARLGQERASYSRPHNRLGS